MADERSYSLKKGSVTVLVLVIMTIMTIYLTVVCKTNSYVTDFIAEQEQFLRMQNNYRGLQQYCVALVKNNFDTVMQDLILQQKPIQFAFTWPPDNKQKYTAQMIMTQAGDAVAFNVVYTHERQNRTLNATIEKKHHHDGKLFFVVAQWQPHG